jgi:hypothetical protein
MMISINSSGAGMEENKNYRKNIYFFITLILILPISTGNETLTAHRSYETVKNAAISADEILIGEFNGFCSLCEKRQINILQISKNLTFREVEISRTKKLKALLSTRESYILDYTKPCAPIFPTFALLLKSIEKKTLLIFYKNCNSARVVMDDREDYPLLYLDPSYQEIELILKEKENHEK